MKKEIKKVRPEVIEAQKDAVLKEVATLEIQYDFMVEEHDKKIVKAKALRGKDERDTALQSLAQQKLQKINPMQDNIEYKSAYYEYLCKLD